MNYVKNVKTHNDPFLCNECRALGYCKSRMTIKEKMELDIFIRKQIGQYNVSSGYDERIATDREIRHWVPIAAINKNGAIQFVKRIRLAHDLFHQGEYEKSKDLYQEILETRCNVDELLIGLAASLYFLDKFEEAVGIAERLNGNIETFIHRFFTSCIKRQQTLQHHKVITDVTTLLEDIFSEGEFTTPEILQPAFA